VKKGSLLIDSSTIDPAVSKELAKEVEKMGAVFMDAPVSGVCSRSMASKTPVGFIGLGNMGNPMAKNLMKHGYPLIIYDVFPDACKEFQDAGEQCLPQQM